MTTIGNKLDGISIPLNSFQEEEDIVILKEPNLILINYNFDYVQDRIIIPVIDPNKALKLLKCKEVKIVQHPFTRKDNLDPNHPPMVIQLPHTTQFQIWGLPRGFWIPLITASVFYCLFIIDLLLFPLVLGSPSSYSSRDTTLQGSFFWRQGHNTSSPGVTIFVYIFILNSIRSFYGNSQVFSYL